MKQQSTVNAVIYARYSSHSQTEQSIEGQLHDAYEFAQREGYLIVGEYIDRAQSGTKDNRRDFQRMIADAAKKQFQAVIVWKLDRFARNRYDSAIYKAKLKKYGIRVVSVMERIQDNPEGIILEGMLESMAEYYSANLSVNIQRGQRESIAKGRYCGGPIPYGYKHVDGKLIADERTAPIIQEVFSRYAAGESMKAIIDSLTERGVKSSSGAALTYNTFSRALLNRCYIGEYTYKGEVIPDLAAPLIDGRTFDAVQEKVSSRKRAPAAGKAKVEYLLQGKCFCGHCGANMVGESGRGRQGETYYYYSCSNRKKKHTCNKLNEKKDFIEWYVVEQTLEYVLSAERMELIAARVVAEYEKEFGSGPIKEKERAIRKIEKELNNLVDTLAEAPKVARQRIYGRIEELEASKADIEVDVAKLKIARGIRFTEAEVKAWLKQFCKGDALDEEFRRRIIDVFINSVYLFDNRIIIFYNIKGGRQVSYIDAADAVEDSGSGSTVSDLIANAPPYASKSEPRYIFVNGVFGIVLERTEEQGE